MTPYVDDPDFILYCGNALEVLRELPDQSVDMICTSPPYWGLRSYGMDGQLGLEPSLAEYVHNLTTVFREARRVLVDTGVAWINLGESYAVGSGGSPNGSGFKDKSANTGGRDLSGMATSRTVDRIKGSGLKPKDMCGVPWRVAFSLQDDGWVLRSDVIWSKPNPVPESITDRPTKSHEYIFMLAKQRRYFFNQEAVREPHHHDGRKITTVAAGPGSIQHRNGERWPNSGRNIRTVWEIATQNYEGAHFATWPEELVKRCILAGCPEDGTVLDCFAGSGTTALVARRLGRRSIAIELNESYCDLASRRLGQQSLLA